MKAFSACAALLAALAATPASASPSEDFERWLTRAVESEMSYPSRLARSGVDGIAVVSFEAGADGRPAHVRLVESSHEPRLDREALRTVSSLGRLPAGAPGGPHLVVLQFGVAASQSQLAERQRELTLAVRDARSARPHSGPRS